MPTETNEKIFIEGDGRSLVGDELYNLLRLADYRIFNLEVPLANDENPINKWGPNLIASTETVAGYVSLGVNLLTLANNHIMDQAEQGMCSTIETLKKANISFLGAGESLQEAQKPFVFEFGLKKIGIYVCAEHEFSIAEEAKAGANPFDPLWSLDHVATLKGQVDYVIVLYHGGKEYYRYPSPHLQKVCRRLVDKGADLVVCQHSHCIGCEEKWGKGTIVYGQGNFLFDCDTNEESQTSLLIKINDNFDISYIPLRKNNETVRMAEETDGKNILSDFEKRGKEIRQDGFLSESYKRLADEQFKRYIMGFYGKRGLLFRAVDKCSGRLLSRLLMKRKYCKENRLEILNYVDCEAHSELLRKGLVNSLNGE